MAPPLSSLAFTHPGTMLDHDGDSTDESTMRYVLLIRGPEDPERRARWSERDTETRGERPTKDARRRTAEIDRSEVRARFVADLQQTKGSTFNALCVRCLDCTADMAAASVHRALWELVEDGTIVHTLVAPIRFILTIHTVEVNL